MSKLDLIKKVPQLETMFVLYSQTTRMPFVSCDEETFDDYICVYFDGEVAKAKAQSMIDEKQPAIVISFEKDKILPFLAELRFAGVNAMRLIDGEDRALVQMKELIQFPEETEEMIQKKPVDNPSLHLSMLYLMQEVRRPIEKEQKKALGQLEEETSANIYKAKFLLPVQATSQEELAKGKEMKSAVLLLKNDKEETFVPLLTDMVEMRKFLKDANAKIVVADFTGVMSILKGSSAAGIVLNPSSSNVVLNKLGMLAIEKRFKGE